MGWGDTDGCRVCHEWLAPGLPALSGLLGLAVPGGAGEKSNM